jgi:hypothetical protein
MCYWNLAKKTSLKKLSLTLISHNYSIGRKRRREGIAHWRKSKQNEKGIKQSLYSIRLKASIENASEVSNSEDDSFLLTTCLQSSLLRQRSLFK